MRRFKVFHLFKKVYIEFDDGIDLNNDRIVISEINGVPMMHALDEVTYGTLVAHASSLEELVGEDKQYENFLQFFNAVNHQVNSSDNRLIIYCDKANFVKLAITWLKIIMPSISHNAAYNIISSYQFQIRMFGTSDSFSYRRPYRLTQVDQYVTEQEFYATFSSTTVNSSVYAGFVNLIKPTLSLEYILASYLFNGSCKEELKTIAHSKISLGMQQFMYECKAYILENLLNKETISRFSPTIDYTPANLESVIRDPAFNVWFDASIWGVESIAVPHAKSLIYFNRITASQYDKIKAHLEIFFAESFLTPSEGLDETARAWADRKFSILNLCRKETLTDSDLTTLVNAQLDNVKSTPDFSLFESNEKTRFNIYILEYIKQLHISNQSSKLSEFTIQ